MGTENKPKKRRLLTKKQFEEHFGHSPNDKCVGCGETLWSIYKDFYEHHPDHSPTSCYYIDDGIYSSKKEGFVCFPCRECDPDYSNTVIIFDPVNKTIEKWDVMEYSDEVSSISGDGIDPTNINQTLKNLSPEYSESADEPCPIQFNFVHTDAWRGYNTPVGKGWVEFHEDCVLAWSEDAEELEKFDTDIKQVLWNLGIKFALCISRTSNLFSQGYDLLVNTEGKKDVGAFLIGLKAVAEFSKLKAKYRDERRFTTTALTGKSSTKEFDKSDDILVGAWNRMQAGEDSEKVISDIKGKLESGELNTSG